FLAVLAVALVVVVGWRFDAFGLFGSGPASGSEGVTPGSTTGSPNRPPTSPSKTGTGSTPTAASTPGPINTKYPGLTTFRGNATRDYYGEGPVPTHPVVRWRYPTAGGLCSTSR